MQLRPSVTNTHQSPGVTCEGKIEFLYWREITYDVSHIYCKTVKVPLATENTAIIMTRFVLVSINKVYF